MRGTNQYQEWTTNAKNIIMMTIRGMCSVATRHSHVSMYQHAVLMRFLFWEKRVSRVPTFESHALLTVYNTFVRQSLAHLWYELHLTLYRFLMWQFEKFHESIKVRSADNWKTTFYVSFFFFDTSSHPTSASHALLVRYSTFARHLVPLCVSKEGELTQSVLQNIGGRLTPGK